MSQIETFIFFDIETTGLRPLVEITELAMIAISRDALLQAGIPGAFPRVMGKLVIHAKPSKAIESEAKAITGKICGN